MTPLCLSIIRSVCDLVCLQPVGSDRPGNMQSAWFCLFTASKEEEEKKITLLFFFFPPGVFVAVLLFTMPSTFSHLCFLLL